MKAAATPRQKLVQASDWDAPPWKSSRHIQLGGDPGVDPEFDGAGLYIPSGRGMPRYPPGRPGKCSWWRRRSENWAQPPSTIT